MLPSCKEATRLLSQREDRKLAFGERVALRVHLVICNGCRNVNAQFKFLRLAVKGLSRDGEPDESSCARCGAPFTCGLRAGQEPCWCASLPALKPVAGRACLCRRCLGDELAKGGAQQAERRDNANDHRP